MEADGTKWPSRSGGDHLRIARTPRVVVAGIHAESNPRNARQIARSEFEEVVGDAVLRHRDFIRLGANDLTLVGGYRARAVSGGFVETGALDALTSELVTHLTALDDIDGILLCMHGAMRTENDVDADGTWISTVRANVPASVPIVGVFDTHGTPSLRGLAALDGITTYRTVPHVDQVGAMRRALRQLRRRIDGDPRPHVVFEPVPLRLPSERAHTGHGPLRSAIDRLGSLPAGIIDADVFIGQAWAPAGVPTVGVVAIGPVERDARDFAKRMANDLWRLRDQFEYPVPALDLDGVAAHLDRLGDEQVVVADSGDVPGAGALGDRLAMLELALAHGAISSLVVGVSIPDWISACTGLPAGAATELRHPDSDEHFDATIVTPVRAIDRLGRCAVVAIRNANVVVVDWRADSPEPALLTSLGLDVRAYQMLVLKTGFIPEAYLEDREPLLALSPGLSDHRVDPRAP